MSERLTREELDEMLAMAKTAKASGFKTVECNVEILTEVISAARQADSLTAQLAAANEQVQEILKSKAAVEHRVASLEHDIGGMVGSLNNTRVILEARGFATRPPIGKVKNDFSGVILDVLDALDSQRSSIAAAKAEVERLQSQLAAKERECGELKESSIDRYFAVLKEEGLPGLSHENGWTLMETAALNQVSEELEALRLVRIEARDLIGQADATGVIPQSNINALRSLLWRSDRKALTPEDQP